MSHPCYHIGSMFLLILLSINQQSFGQYKVNNFFTNSAEHTPNFNSTPYSSFSNSRNIFGTDEDDIHSWLDLGYGISSTGPSFIACFSYQFDYNLISFRGTLSGDFIFGDDHMSDFGLLYGRATSAGLFHASVAAGLGLAGGNFHRKHFSYQEEVSMPLELSIPMELQLYIRPQKKWGVGVYSFINLNAENPFAGITFSLQFGSLF